MYVRVGIDFERELSVGKEKVTLKIFPFIYKWLIVKKRKEFLLIILTVSHVRSVRLFLHYNAIYPY